MPLYCTFFSGVSPSDQNGASLPLFGRKLGISKVTVGASAASATVAAQTGLVRIYATEDCIVDIGTSNSVTNSNGEFWQAGKDEARAIAAGQFVSVKTAP